MSINGAQKLQLSLKSILNKYQFHSKIYADFECNLESAKSYEGSYSKKCQDHIPCSFAYKLVCVDDKFSKSIAVFRGKNAAYKFIEAILKDNEHCKKVMKKHFNKN